MLGFTLVRGMPESMSALICIASVIFGACLWWRFPIFYHLGGEAGYWVRMVIFAIVWPLMLPMFACGFLIFYLIPHGIMWICSPTHRKKKEGSKKKAAASHKPGRS